MGELVQDCKVLEVHMRCDTCGEGMMVPTGVMFPTNPPLYQHECSRCGVIEDFPQTYPYIRTVAVGDIREPKEEDVD